MCTGRSMSSFGEGCSDLVAPIIHLASTTFPFVFRAFSIQFLDSSFPSGSPEMEFVAAYRPPQWSNDQAQFGRFVGRVAPAGR